MKLYHGSNVEVAKPRLISSGRRLDFGAGFYTTSDPEQAKRWARLTARRRKEGEPLVSVYEFDESILNDLSVLRFDEASVEWLEYVAQNRMQDAGDDDFDIVIGPVANDRTMPVLRYFFLQIYTAEEAVKRLLPQKLTDQYAFRTQRAIDALHFCEVIGA